MNPTRRKIILGLMLALPLAPEATARGGRGGGRSGGRSSFRSNSYHVSGGGSASTCRDIKDPTEKLRCQQQRTGNSLGLSGWLLLLAGGGFWAYWQSRK